MACQLLQVHSVALIDRTCRLPHLHTCLSSPRLFPWNGKKEQGTRRALWAKAADATSFVISVQRYEEKARQCFQRTPSSNAVSCASCP